MASIRQTSEAYVSPVTKNISELSSVNTETEIKTKTVNKGTEGEFTYAYIVVDKEEYRVPNVVLKQLKEQLEENPSSVKFKVKKKGEGLKSEYFVIMLD